MKISKEIVVHKTFVSPGDAKCPKKPRDFNVNGRDATAAERRSQPVVRKNSDWQLSKQR